jgi:hypothetical protein
MALTEGKRIGDWLKYEAPNKYSREVVTLVSGQNLKSGTVVGKITSGGKYTAYDDDNSDGSETAAGLLCYDTDASGGDVATAVIVKRDAIVSSNGITWASTNDATDKTNGIADLLAIGILVRDGA